MKMGIAGTLESNDAMITVKDSDALIISVKALSTISFTMRS